MFKHAPLIAFASVIMIISQACGASAPVTPDPNYINTSVAKTLAAIVSPTVPSPVVSATALQTFTPSPSPSPIVTPSPFIIFTVTPSTPLISVTVDTNCRVGPGQAYQRVGALLVGEVAEVYGRDPTGAYWYIRNPDVDNGFCWLWGEYATLSGNIEALPIYTPPPTATPAPAFEAEYAGLEVCNGWYLEFKLKNTGPVTFRSLSVSVLDKKKNQTLSLTQNKFISHDGCTETKTLQILVAGDKITVSSAIFKYDPSGDKMLATIRLCTEDDLKGTCLSQELEFKP